MKSYFLLNIFLLTAFVASVALNWMGAPNTSRPNLEYMPNMAHSVRFAAFSPNPNFPDGKTLREPVPGTIPRGFHPLSYQATPQDAIRAGEELLNPLSMTDARALDRGASVFANFCQPCHGSAGTGNGPVAMRGFPAPPSLLADHAINMKDGQMFHVLTYGQNNMPPYRTQISSEDRWKAVLFLRSLQKQAPPQAVPQRLTPSKPRAASTPQPLAPLASTSSGGKR
jgi:mono/diheme cytochrome c family protein